MLQSHPSQVRFTDEMTLDRMRDAIRQGPDGIEKQHLVTAMFDRSRLRIGGVLHQSALLPPLETMQPAEWDVLQSQVQSAITDVIRLLLQTFDLSSKEWKNAPAIWEMLSFDQQVLRSPVTPLPQALRGAIDTVRPILEVEGLTVDLEELANDLDEVIHQTSARRSVIEGTLRAATGAEISDTPILHTDGIRNQVITGLRQRIHVELEAADLILAELASEAICKACHPQEATPSSPFRLSAADVTRVTGEEAMHSNIGDVYLVRSANVQSRGDHFIVITGGLVQKPHGMRPQDMSFPVPEGMISPLSAYPESETLVLLKLDTASSQAFYAEFDVPEQFRHS